MATVLINKITESAKIPAYAHEEDAGMDLFSDENATIKQNEIKCISTGIRIELPKDIEGQVRPKSGLALNYGLTVLNTPGTIDPNYRGEIKVILINLGKEIYEVKKGTKIAQLIFNKIEKPEIKIVEKLSETKRNEKGFGSTGLT
ncbi:MAG: dUTP diphosphatase [Candidatus Diapherotrites archaeon CG08_land_8_20_14_0_20_34_12]|nr:MAG: dUTP diphosphatase [Candidatus Diapherotrites archaeon CG08_land_8_20_14_0_20_34_12]